MSPKISSAVPIVPTFDHPLHLHTPEYVEAVEDGKRYFTLVQSRGMSSKIRYWTADSTNAHGNKPDLPLDEAVRVSAKTTETLLGLGMDITIDKREQLEWLEKNPYPDPDNELFPNKTRLPLGLDAIDIFKSMVVDQRDSYLEVTPPKHRESMEELCYKLGMDEKGVPINTPILGVEPGLHGQMLVKMLGERKRLDEVSEEEKKNIYVKARKRNKEQKKISKVLPPKDIYTSAIGVKLSALLSEYDKQIVQDAVQLRTYITNKLLEISTSGNPKDELRALELLGKISDVGLFVEKSEVNITTTSTAALEHAIKDKINRILGQQNVQIEDAEYEEVQTETLNPADYELVDNE
jgi:copper chaperone CopZ